MRILYKNHKKTYYSNFSEKSVDKGKIECYNNSYKPNRIYRNYKRGDIYDDAEKNTMLYISGNFPQA